MLGKMSLLETDCSRCEHAHDKRKKQRSVASSNELNQVHNASFLLIPLLQKDRPLDNF